MTSHRCPNLLRVSRVKVIFCPHNLWTQQNVLTKNRRFPFLLCTTWKDTQITEQNFDTFRDGKIKGWDTKTRSYICWTWRGKEHATGLFTISSTTFKAGGKRGSVRTFLQQHFGRFVHAERSSNQCKLAVKRFVGKQWLANWNKHSPKSLGPSSSWWMSTLSSCASPFSTPVMLYSTPFSCALSPAWAAKQQIPQLHLTCKHLMPSQNTQQDETKNGYTKLLVTRNDQHLVSLLNCEKRAEGGGVWNFQTKNGTEAESCVREHILSVSENKRRNSETFRRIFRKFLIFCWLGFEYAVLASEVTFKLREA